MGADEHRAMAAKSVVCAVITVSDTRTEESDTSGKTIMDTLRARGHDVKGYAIVKDDIPMIQGKLREFLEDKTVQAVILNGGTGITSRDSTIEAIEGFAEKEMPGFGELFRALSYEEIGAAAMMSRAIAFLCEKKIVFALPGSTAAVKLAVEKLIAGELGHMIWEANR
jgi:molybdenum cofactor biosynthesis protein B